jgi:3-oxocholest-4-en-26-oyl-CoA dehydrogenase beta subunit
MEFELNEEQEAVAQSADAVFSGMSKPERVAEVETGEDRFDDELWAALARSHLLGLAIPAEFGGSGLGLTELCLLLEAQGRAVAPAPIWATTVLGSMPLSHFGTPAQKERWLPGVASGEVKLSAALTEVSAYRSGRGLHLPRTRVEATRDGQGWRLRGTARAVPQAHLADAVLVPADVSISGSAETSAQGSSKTPDAKIAVFLVDLDRNGIDLERATTTDRQVHPHLHLRDVAVTEADLLGTIHNGPGVVEWILDRARTGLCAIALGVCEEAVRRTAGFLNERQQFGRPLSSFQATMLRAADAFIDTEAIRVTLWQAAWLLDSGRAAAEAVAAAKWWASEAGQRVVHATQHLHGGLGADVEYPIHRYFLWGKQLELMLGGPSSELARLGSLLAERLRPQGATTSSSTSSGIAK